MIKFKDRNNVEFCLGPTHEEVLMASFKNYIQTYKQLPAFFYQIGVKFRDEIRPRKGLIRTKEFSMKDGYSFHQTQDDLRIFYNDVKEAYKTIFNKIGLDVDIIDAPNEEMGGSNSEEFIAKSNIVNSRYKEDEIEVGHVFDLGDSITKGLIWL